jgi:hypothetical protein
MVTADTIESTTLPPYGQFFVILICLNRHPARDLPDLDSHVR